VIFGIAKTAQAAGLKLQSNAEAKQSGATMLIAFNRVHSLSGDANT
jgi:hypothetical protein